MEHGIQCMPCSSQIVSEMQPEINTIEKLLGGLSLPRKSVVRLTDYLNMTLDIFRGRKTTQQQQQWKSLIFSNL